MNLLEAVKEGRRVRRKAWKTGRYITADEVWGHLNPADKYQSPVRLETEEDMPFTFTDVQMWDWEVEPKTITISEDDYWDAVSAVRKSLRFTTISESHRRIKKELFK